MSDDKQVAPPLSGEVLPPQRAEASFAIDPPLSGVPFLNRIRYHAIRKELEAYLAVLATRNAILREVDEAARLNVQIARGLARMEHVEDLRAIERLTIDAELDEALERALEARRKAELNALRHRRALAELEAGAIERERRLEAAKSPPAEPAQPTSQADSIAAELKEFAAQERTLIAALVEQAGGEDHLSDEDRELIADVRLAMRDRKSSLIDQLRR